MTSRRAPFYIDCFSFSRPLGSSMWTTWPVSSSTTYGTGGMKTPPIGIGSKDGGTLCFAVTGTFLLFSQISTGTRKNLLICISFSLSPCVLAPVPVPAQTATSAFKVTVETPITVTRVSILLAGPFSVLSVSWLRYEWRLLHHSIDRVQHHLIPGLLGGALSGRSEDGRSLAYPVFPLHHLSREFLLGQSDSRYRSHELRRTSGRLNYLIR